MRNGKQHGFTYLSLIILVAIIGLASAATIKLGALLQRSAAERELLAIGAEYADALESYAKATPPGQSPLPPSFKELLRDTRFPNVRRHLRHVYVDPLTGKAEWGVVYAAGAAQQGSGAGTPSAPGSAAGAPGGAPLATPAAAAARGMGGGGAGGSFGGGFGSGLGGSTGPGLATGIQSAQSTSQSPQGGTGGIVAFFSLSTAKPVKVGNFPARFQGFDNREKISDWKFARAEGQAGQPQPGQVQPGQPQPGQPPGTAPVEPPSEPPSAMPPAPQPEAPEAPPADAQPQRHGDEPAPEEPPSEAPQDKSRSD